MRMAKISRSLQLEVEEYQKADSPKKIEELTAELELTKKEIKRLEGNNVNLLTVYHKVDTKFRDLLESKKEWLVKEAGMVEAENKLKEKLEGVMAALKKNEAEAAEKGRTLADIKAKLAEKEAAVADLGAKLAEAVDQVKAKDTFHEEFKVGMEVICGDKWDEGYKYGDEETRQIISTMDPNFDWARFDALLDEKEKKEEAEREANKVAEEATAKTTDPVK